MLRVYDIVPIKLVVGWTIGGVVVNANNNNNNNNNDLNNKGRYASAEG